MLGTIVNTIAIIVGSIIGLVIKGNIPQKYKMIILQAIGLSILFLGIQSAVSNMGQANPILFIIALVLGSICGEAMDLEGRLTTLGNLLEKKLGTGQSDISKGFVHASILFCVGSMAILGSLQSGIQNKHQILFSKSILDGITSILFSSSFGIGVLFSAVSVFLYQGTLTLLSGLIEQFLTDSMLVEISLIGGILMTGLGLTMLEIKKINVSNMLPSLVVPIIYYLFVK